MSGNGMGFPPLNWCKCIFNYLWPQAYLLRYSIFLILMNNSYSLPQLKLLFPNMDQNQNIRLNYTLLKIVPSLLLCCYTAYSWLWCSEPSSSSSHHLWWRLLSARLTQEAQCLASAGPTCSLTIHRPECTLKCFCISLSLLTQWRAVRFLYNEL